MSRLNHLRKLPRISYYEPDEPNYDEYIFCRECRDYVYEYCSIHGPLLVIPDQKVPTKSNFPPQVPRSAQTIPGAFLHLAPSSIPGAGIGVFSTLALPVGVRFGPYRGKITKDVDSVYCWQIYDKNNRPLHVVDGADDERSNWMRYVNCSRHWSEQNLLAYQYKGQVYYRTIKLIPRFTELLVFYGCEFANMLNVDLRFYNTTPHIYYENRRKILSEKEFTLPSPLMVKKVEDNSTKITDYDDKNSKDEVGNEIRKRNQRKKLSESRDVKKKNKTKPSESKKITQEYKCDGCCKMFASKEILNKHISQCVKTKSNPSALNDSSLTNTDIRTKSTEILVFNSDICPVEKRNIAHLKTHDGDQIFSKDFCNYTAINGNNSKDNITNTEGTQISDFKNSDLNRPKLLHSSEQLCSYNIDQYKCAQNYDLKSQIYVKKPYSCKTCQYKSKQKSNLKRHMRTHTGDKPFSCDMCQYRCIRKSDLKNHMRTHTGDKPFSCDMCQYRCIQKSNLKRHMRTHTGDKPFSCDMCQYSCIQKSDLKNHMRTHTGDKPFSCDICQYRCIQKSNLKNHMRTHTGDKPFSCDMCQYKCSLKHNLKSHMRTHTGDKPFSCDMCQYRCIQKSTLKNHTRTHTGDKPFSCDMCQYRCIQKSNLKNHMRTHTGDKPFSCDMCQYKCVKKGNLEKHMRAHMGN